MKYLFTFSFVLFLGAFLTAQVSIGPRIITEFNNLQGGEAGNSSSRLSYRLGGFAQITMGPDFILRPEIYLGSRGGRVKSAGGQFVYSEALDAYLITDLTQAKYNFVYTDLAVLFAFAPRETDQRLQFFAGPRMSYLLSARAKRSEQEYLLTPNSDRWQLGFALGVDYELDSKVIMGIRFSRDVMSVFKEVNMQNESIGFQLAYRLGE
jgi:hypothetical protein